MQFMGIGWHGNYVTANVGLANFLTIVFILVVLIEAAVYFRKRWKEVIVLSFY